MYFAESKPLNKSNNKVYGTAYCWRERHHYWVKYYYADKKKPKKHNIGQKAVQKFVQDLLNHGWRVFIRMPDEKGNK